MEVAVRELRPSIFNWMPWLILPVLDDGGGGVQKLILVPAAGALSRFDGAQWRCCLHLRPGDVMHSHYLRRSGAVQRCQDSRFLDP